MISVAGWLSKAKSSATNEAGPNAGAKNDKKASYLFRIEGDKFLELHGMMKRDSGKPSLAVGEQLKVDPIPKQGA